MSLHEVQWACLGQPPKVDPCGALGTTDKGAEAHVKVYGHATGRATTCWVTVYDATGSTDKAHKPRPCGLPAVLGALRQKHADDRERLGGAA